MQKAAGTIISILLMIASSISHAKDVKKIKTFGDWDVVIAKDRTHCSDNNGYVHAISAPKSSNNFIGSGESYKAPYAIVSQIMPGAWTISIRPSISETNNVHFTLVANGRAYSLSKAHEMFTLTTSSTQDVSIINNFIDESADFQIHAHTINAQIALDTYSLEGLINALKYIERNFKNVSCAN